MQRAEALNAPIKADSGTIPPLSWDLTLWRKRGAEAASSPSKLALFEEIILPHLDAAYNLARWLTRNEYDAQDVVQESYLRAYKFFDGYRGGDSKAWLLAVVRNTCRSWQRRQNRDSASVPFDEVAHSGDGRGRNQEQSLGDREEAGVLRNCIEKLPEDFREVLVMRELEEMSYQEIANATGLPLGTVMSRLSRARKRLEECAGRPATEAAR
jgi:RNA polymerase sigma-70 factor, ECF subfamily